MRLSDTQAVSPVIGVMLMLIVTIIVAAVVAGFSGGMFGGNHEKAPSLVLDVKIINSGVWPGSGFSATVVGENKPIPTRDIRIVTSWTILNKTTGEMERHGNTVMPGVPNLNHDICNAGQWGATPGSPGPDPAKVLVVPFGGGPGVEGWDTASTAEHTLTDNTSRFGDYTLVPGTTLSAPTQKGTCNLQYATEYPVGYYAFITLGAYGSADPFKYPDPTFIDPAVAVLGKGWENLRAGDTVNVKVFHIPTNSIIFERNVQVSEGG